MTVPVLDSEFLRAAMPRAADGSLSGFLAQLDRVSGCAHPVRLFGHIDHVDTATGEVRRVLDTADMPDGLLLVPCGNRRASVCPSCSYLYAGDAWQIVHSGLTGGHDVPATVAEHPGLFVTVTAPSFGPVHSRRANHGPAQVCNRRQGRCPHGRARGCGFVHGEDDWRLGTPLCPDCHDDGALIVWNRTSGRLWKRTVDATYRRMATVTGMTERGLRRAVRISYVKVGEAQRRGAVHFHALLRLDAGSDSDVWQAPPAWATGDLLASCWRWAVTHTEEPCPDPHAYDLPSEADALATLAAAGLLASADIPPPAPRPAPMRAARWGEQHDVKKVLVDGGDLTPQAVGNYLAKYITKSVVDSGLLDRRIRDADDLEARLPFLGEFHARLVHTAWRLGPHPEFQDLRLRQWAHQLGFNGHWLTKSRGYSTTFAARRTARRTWRRTHVNGEERPALDAFGRPDDTDETVIIPTWRYHSSGYTNNGDRWLASMAADQARSRREVTRDHRSAA
ncbi:hypothetical protein ThrDRAFT_01541 [Frankia casuarinae]|uniref:Plasmid replication initiator protein n=1 Tax=Frankia casuarinae (strain DSM 45818 / CECT 9043 / HFP020203 / CcI3) TaxID=106370 RepID=Q2J523_FRACC|nr:replication initiator [Frankia casuarinae]ABD13619.1 putative plasmid replication initiator protein [Frankia casuarinae]EYT92766.1 hypothetical protein ThrDRAFT_01541 [Frankia casuarinae]